MKTTLVLIYLSCLPLVCCTQNNSQASLRDSSKNPLIVFYHITEKSRSELAENLKKIDSFSPKLIAIETIFEELQLPHEDSILASALAGLDNVILCADLTNPGPVVGRSHKYFRNDTIHEGLLSYLVDEEGTTVEYIPLYQDNNGQMVSFPAEIVFNFHPETIQRFLKMKVGEAAPIHWVQDLDDFEIMDKDRIRPELIHDKIVIAGDLDVDDDYFVVEFPDGKRKTFSLVITANIVQQILLDNTGNINVTNGK